MTEISELADGGWTVEQAIRHLLFDGDDVDPSKAEELEAIADAFKRAEFRRLANVQVGRPVIRSCPVIGDLGRYNRNNWDWVNAAGNPLKQALSSGEMIAYGCPGTAAAPVQKIEPFRWDAVFAFDTEINAALDDRWRPLFVCLRIVLASAPISKGAPATVSERELKEFLASLANDRGRVTETEAINAVKTEFRNRRVPRQRVRDALADLPSEKRFAAHRPSRS